MIAARSSRVGQYKADSPYAKSSRRRRSGYVRLGRSAGQQRHLRRQLYVGGSFVGDRGFIGFAFGRYGSEYEVPGEEPVFIDGDQKRFDFKAALNDPLPSVERIKLDAGYNDYEHTEFEAPGEPGTEFLNDEFEAGWKPCMPRSARS
jgi:hypothetical protein